MNSIIARIKRMVAQLKTASPKARAVLLVKIAAASLAMYTAYRVSVNKKSEVSQPAQVQLGEQESVSSNSRNNQGIVASNDSYEQCKADTFPSFINVSLTWDGYTFGNALKSLSPPSIIVVAAGNNHPKPIRYEKVKASKDFNAIIVGSMAPDGQRSDFSHTHEEVHIMAPADSYQSSADENGNRMAFGGTSGATPLVTGSLAGFEWLSGYHPTAEEAKTLLEKTAVPTLAANKVPRLSGAGMLNAYKLGMVGKRLKSICGKNIVCFKEMIQKDSTYNFPEDKGLIQEVNSAFPQCSNNQCGKESSKTCEDKGAVFERLRKAAFLNPSNGELWRNIACIYDSGNFTKNAQGAMSIYKATFGNIDMSLYTSCEVNEDCTHVPSCSLYRAGRTVLLPVNKSYVAECQARVLCNNKCRCGNQEFDLLTKKKNVFGSRQAYCINSKCISRYNIYTGRRQSIEERQPASAQQKNIDGGIGVNDVSGASIDDEADIGGSVK